ERGRGRPQQALAAHQAAGELADDLALAIPGVEGRSNFVTAHARGDADHVTLLLEQGQPEAALCVAAASRARHMRSLWSRLRPALPPAERERYRQLLAAHQRHRLAVNERLKDAWSLSDAELGELRETLRDEAERDDARIAEATALLEGQAPRWSCDALLPPEPGEGLLTMIRSRDEAVFLLATERTVVAERILVGDQNPEQLAVRAIMALANEIVSLRELRVIPAGAFMTVPFHREMMTRLPRSPVVRYSLGLGRPASEIPRQTPPRAAVIVGAEDLAGVVEEARKARASLEDGGWSVTSRWSPEDPQQPLLLHYSGHGHRRGPGGWQSDLELPDYGRLSAAALVAGAQAPTWVVLAACSAAAPDPRTVDGGMNLASAFILAGAELVIAPTEAVDDKTAQTLGEALYQGTGALPTGDSTIADVLVHKLTAMQRSQLSSGEPEDPARSYATWRAWEG
ncbi:MAG: CHAT domain-containing protein, partial [Myxococcales bacterium]|nr:CHAT domain-containing protein [Myxococcales bacterium]